MISRPSVVKSLRAFGAPNRRAVALCATAASLVLTMATAGCTTGTANAEGLDCSAFAGYGSHRGTHVRVEQSATAANGALMQQAWAAFSDCTGISVDLVSEQDFETKVGKNVTDGKAPDLAVFPQPGLMAGFARKGQLKALPSGVRSAVSTGWSADWQKLGEVDGTPYAAPLSSSVKSLVWYSPKTFASHGWKVPSTWDELLRLSSSASAAGVTPWCVGFESGGATGWPGTDWVEDAMLRTAGPDAYDGWVKHSVRFNDPAVVRAMDLVAGVLKNPDFVNATSSGHGSVASIATTSFGSAGLPVLNGRCAMHRQASFYASFWPAGTDISPTGDVYAFYLPPVKTDGSRPVLVAGELVAAFTDRPEVAALQTYLASPDFAARRIKLGGWVSANTKVDVGIYTSPIDKLSAQILTDSKSLARFDGSDQMPAAVGAGTFWTGMTQWVKGASTASTLDAIERSWPTS